MSIQNIFDFYCNKMTQIHLYQRAMHNIAKKELKSLYEYTESLKENPKLKEYSSSIDRMHFRIAKDGSLRTFGFKKTSPQERVTFTYLHQNKQYQWLLAEAYEAFEDFLESAYAYAGYTDNNFWPLKDFGNITIKELSSQSYEWFEQQAKKKKDKPNSIITKFRDKFPKISNLEKNNGFGLNLRLAIILVQFLRHIIVHRGGVVSNKEEFIKNVLKSAGLYNNGKINEKHEHLIKSYFGISEYENTIILLEVETNTELPIDSYISVFGALSDILMAYAHMISESLLPNENPEQ